MYHRTEVSKIKLKAYIFSGCFFSLLMCAVGKLAQSISVSKSFFAYVSSLPKKVFIS